MADNIWGASQLVADRCGGETCTHGFKHLKPVICFSVMCSWNTRPHPVGAHAPMLAGLLRATMWSRQLEKT